MTLRSQENLLAAWTLLLSQRQDFLNNPPARIPITFNQQGPMEIRRERLSSLGAWNKDTSGSKWILSLLNFIERIPTWTRTRDWYPFSTSSVVQLGNGRISRKPHSTQRWGVKGEFATHNFSLWKNQSSPSVAAKSNIWNKKWKSSWFRSQNFDPLTIIVYVFW